MRESELSSVITVRGAELQGGSLALGWKEKTRGDRQEACRQMKGKQAAAPMGDPFQGPPGKSSAARCNPKGKISYQNTAPKSEML